VIGIQAVQECKDYIDQNRQEIERDILIMYEKGAWIYCGKIGEGNPKSNYYVYQDYLLVADKEKENTITLHRTDFLFPRATTIKVIKDLTREIKKKQARLERVTAIADKQLSKQKAKFEVLDQESNELRKRLQEIDHFKKELKQSMASIRAKPEALEAEIRELAFQLCYGSNYTGNQRKSG
jgi:hypothetical protein